MKKIIDLKNVVAKKAREDRKWYPTSDAEAIALLKVYTSLFFKRETGPVNEWDKLSKEMDSYFHAFTNALIAGRYMLSDPDDRVGWVLYRLNGNPLEDVNVFSEGDTLVFAGKETDVERVEIYFEDFTKME